MWEKNFRKKEIWVYRKKYKCPRCGEYTLHIIHDSACECEEYFCNTDDIEEKEINQIIEKDDYNGYYTSSDIKECFIDIEDDVQRILKEVGLDKAGYKSSYDEKTNEKIRKLFEKCDAFDEFFTDMVIDLIQLDILTENNKRTNMDIKGYIVNLIEDIHTFINLAYKDIVLFDFAVSETSRYFFSGRFFMYNCIEHFSLAFDRVQVLIAILFGYQFNTDIHSDRNSNYERYFKKVEAYKNSSIKPIYDSLKSLTEFREIRNMRGYNDHDISYMNNRIIEQASSNDIDRKKYESSTSNDVDKELWLPKIPGLIVCIEKLYDLLDNLTVYFKDNCKKEYVNAVPLLSYFSNMNGAKQINITNRRKYDVQDFEKNNRLKQQYFLELVKIADKYLLDMFFRLDEITRCVEAIYNMINDDCFFTYDRIRVDLIDNEYMIYSALFRIYSCYDKIGKYIAQKYNLNIMYFNDISTIEENYNVVTTCKKVLANDYYKMLDRYRNDIYHNLRNGCLYGEDGLGYHHVMIFICLMENISLIFEILQSFTPISIRTNNIATIPMKKKVGRNDMCPCGSGRKYKFCCGK